MKVLKEAETYIVRQSLATSVPVRQEALVPEPCQLLVAHEPLPALASPARRLFRGSDAALATPLAYGVFGLAQQPRSLGDGVPVLDRLLLDEESDHLFEPVQAAQQEVEVLVR